MGDHRCDRPIGPHRPDISTLQPLGDLPSRADAEAARVPRLRPSASPTGHGGQGVSKPAEPTRAPLDTLPQQHPTDYGVTKREDLLRNPTEHGGIWPTMCELVELRGREDWRDLISYVAKEALNVRQCLSHHVTTSCRVRKEPGPFTSLKASGLDTPVDDEGSIRVRVSTLHTLTKGDNLKLVQTSTGR